MQVEVRSICSIYDANILAQSNSLRFRKKDLRDILEYKKKATHLAPSHDERTHISTKDVEEISVLLS